MVGFVSQEPAPSSLKAVSSQNQSSRNLDSREFILLHAPPSVYSPRLTLNISEPLVRHPGIRRDGAAGPRQPSRAIGLIK
ncbi:hypothetical protein [Mesorhizobium sp. M0243]|uniref:hypothetical protein n=1 Tax=Mesorhizobium sp. M0243 TaxID=2956925 RepID=UPI003335B04A